MGLLNGKNRKGSEQDRENAGLRSQNKVKVFQKRHVTNN